MEIVCIDAEVFDSLVENLSALANEVEALCTQKDYSLHKWLDNQDVCEILNVSYRTLQYFRDTGMIPYTQIDRKIYYKPADVQDFLNTLRKKKQ